MNINREDFIKKHCIQLEDRVIYPIYEYETYNEKDDSYSGLKIIKKAEEMTQQIDICTDKPKTNEELTKENEQLWETVQFLLKKTGMIGVEANET